MLEGITLAVARQAGSAAALAPVIRELRASGNGVIVWAATDTARDGFELSGISADESSLVLPAGPRLAAWLRRRDVRGVVTGTSFEPSLDGRFWSAAHLLGVPSVAVLDHWSYYQERFSSEAPFDCLPDALAVMNDVAMTALVDLGFPQDRIHVTGHPALDAIMPVTRSERRHARRLLGISETRRVVTFASEPITEESHTAADALEAVHFAMSAVAPDGLLVLRPHPRDDQAAGLVRPIRDPETIVVRSGAPRDAIALTDAMTGMRSIILLEAALAGIPTLSVRPNGGPNHYLDIHAQLITSVCDRTLVPDMLQLALANRATVVRPPPSAEAARRVIRLLASLSSRQPRKSASSDRGVR